MLVISFTTQWTVEHFIDCIWISKIGLYHPKTFSWQSNTRAPFVVFFFFHQLHHLTMTTIDFSECKLSTLSSCIVMQDNIGTGLGECQCHIALPIPPDDPVMSAVFPERSNEE
jgi:hypothetical protein